MHLAMQETCLTCLPNKYRKMPVGTVQDEWNMANYNIIITIMMISESQTVCRGTVVCRERILKFDILFK